MERLFRKRAAEASAKRRAAAWEEHADGKEAVVSRPRRVVAPPREEAEVEAASDRGGSSRAPAPTARRRGSKKKRRPLRLVMLEASVRAAERECARRVVAALVDELEMRSKRDRRRASLKVLAEAPAEKSKVVVKRLSPAEKSVVAALDAYQSKKPAGANRQRQQIDAFEEERRREKARLVALREAALKEVEARDLRAKKLEAEVEEGHERRVLEAELLEHRSALEKAEAEASAAGQKFGLGGESARRLKAAAALVEEDERRLEAMVGPRSDLAEDVLEATQRRDRARSKLRQAAALVVEEEEEEAGSTVMPKLAAAGAFMKGGRALAQRRSRVRSAFFEALGDDSMLAVHRGISRNCGISGLVRLACVSQSASLFAAPELGKMRSCLAIQSAVRAVPKWRLFQAKAKEQRSARKLRKLARAFLFKQRAADRLFKRRVCNTVERDLGYAVAIAYGELIGLQMAGVIDTGPCGPDIAMSLAASFQGAPKDCEAVILTVPTVAKAAKSALERLSKGEKTGDTALLYLEAVKAAKGAKAALAVLLDDATSGVLSLALQTTDERIHSVAATALRDWLRALFLSTTPVKERVTAAENLVSKGTFKALVSALNTPCKVDSVLALAILDSAYILLERWPLRARPLFIECGATKAVFRFLVRLTLAYAADAERKGGVSQQGDLVANLASQVTWVLCDGDLTAAYEDDLCVVSMAAMLGCSKWPLIQKLACVTVGLCSADRPRAAKLAPLIPILEDIVQNGADETVKYPAMVALEEALCLASDEDASSKILGDQLTTQGILDTLQNIPVPGAPIDTRDLSKPIKIHRFDARILNHHTKEAKKVDPAAAAAADVENEADPADVDDEFTDDDEDDGDGDFIVDP